MDCEKFEQAMMDELYGELDELTSAAAKRHVAVCAKCASLLEGLRATKRVASLPSASSRLRATCTRSCLSGAGSGTPFRSREGGRCSRRRRSPWSSS